MKQICIGLFLFLLVFSLAEYVSANSNSYSNSQENSNTQTSGIISDTEASPDTTDTLPDNGSVFYRPSKRF